MTALVHPARRFTILRVAAASTTLVTLTGLAAYSTMSSPRAAERGLPVRIVEGAMGGGQGEHATLLQLTHEGDAGTQNASEARQRNGAIGFAHEALKPALPFRLTAPQAEDGERALRCLTQAVYYEAGFEPLAGRRAVAQVVLNRVRHPAFPHSVCGVVYEGHDRPGCQFSFTCDGALAFAPAARAWSEARQVAQQALAGRVEPAVGMATHYHADYVFPRWAPRLAKLSRIGAHIFYRWPGGWGTPAAFRMHYAGGEVIPPAARAAAPGGTAPAPFAEMDVPAVARLPERRAENDLGGRLDPSKGWTLKILLPAQSGNSLAAITGRQDQLPVNEKDEKAMAQATLPPALQGGQILSGQVQSGKAMR